MESLRAMVAGLASGDRLLVLLEDSSRKQALAEAITSVLGEFRAQQGAPAAAQAAAVERIDTSNATAVLESMSLTHPRRG